MKNGWNKKLVCISSAGNETVQFCALISYLVQLGLRIQFNVYIHFIKNSFMKSRKDENGWLVSFLLLHAAPYDGRLFSFACKAETRQSALILFYLFNLLREDFSALKLDLIWIFRVAMSHSSNKKMTIFWPILLLLLLPSPHFFLSIPICESEKCA